MPLHKIGALWSKTSPKNGNKYLAGTIKEETVLLVGSKVLAFRVKEKTNENSPDFELFLSVEEEEPRQQGGHTGNKGGQQGPPYRQQGYQGGQGGQNRQQGQAQNNQRQGRQNPADDIPDDFDF